MDETKQLPAPEPVEVAPPQPTSALPPPEPVATQAPSTAPAAPPSGTALPAPQSVETTDKLPGTAPDSGVLSRLKAVFDNPRSFFNPNNFLSTKNDNVFTQTDADPNSPAYVAHMKAVHDQENGVTERPEDRPMMTLEGAMTDDEARQHPEEYGLFQMLTDFTSPKNVAMALGTEGFGALSTTGLKALPALVSLGFSYQQINDAIEKIPQIKAAINRGDTFEAHRLMAQAVTEGLLGTLAGVHGVKGTHAAISERIGVGKSFAHTQYNEAARDLISGRQIASGKGHQTGEMGLATMPEVEDRRGYTEFREAGKDVKELEKRQKETLAGPTSAEALAAAQGTAVPLDEQQLANASKLQSDREAEIRTVDPSAGSGPQGGHAGGGVASEEEINRPGRFVKIDRSGRPTDQGKVPDFNLKTGEAGYQVKPDGTFELKAGQETNATAAGVKAYAKEAFPSQSKTSLRPGVTDDPEMRKLVEDAGGVYRGQSKDGKIEITLPRSMTESLKIDNRMKNYVSVTVDAKDATPESIKSAIDAKFKEYGGVPKPQVFASPAAEATQGLFSESAKESAQASSGGGQPQVMTSPAVAEKQGLFSEEAKANAQAPGNGQAPQTFTSTAAQETLDMKKALEDAKKAAADHVVTKEEREQMAREQDPNRKYTKQGLEAAGKVEGWMEDLKQALQKRGLLPQGQLTENFVPHDWGFDDVVNSLRKRIFGTYHAGQQSGLVAPNKDFFALSADYLERGWRKVANHDFVQKMKNGQTNDGRPLAVQGGFVEGQKVSAEGPQSYVIGDKELGRLKSKGQLTDLIRDGHVVQNPDGTFTMKNDDYVKTNFYETRPIGPTPIPPNVLADLKENGILDQLEQRGLVYKDANGNYINKEQLYARVPVYAHPDVAEHMNKSLMPTKVESSPALNFYDKLTGNMKSLMLSWSPFHKVTEGLRMGESMGLRKAYKTYFFAPDVDYFNLKPEQVAAIRDGIVVSNPTGASQSRTAEGLGAESGTLAAKSYKLFNDALKKVGLPESIRNFIDPQKILNENVFGPNGTITHAKFALYDQMKPGIIDAMTKDHPDWSQEKVALEAGRKAAQFANNKFGGFNYILAGRGIASQNFMRRVLLAPDFLETTGRSMLDLADPYGSSLVRKMIQFQLTVGLTTAAINYAYHHNEAKKQTLDSVLDSSHILDHPFEVVSPDGKTVYGMRTTVNDFLRFAKDPHTFGFDRLNPAIRSAYEMLTRRNAYGRKESFAEASKSLPKSMMPIWMQSLIPGMTSTALAEPSKSDQVLKAFGVGGRPNRSQAEQFALAKVSEHLQGQPVLEGQALVRQQLKLRAEDKLRDAYATEDPVQKKQAVQDALAAVNNLTMRRIIDPEERKKILTDSKSSRLVSIFNSLTPMDALTAWDKATNKEKEQLGVAMHAKFVRWIEHVQKKGSSIGNLNEDDQQILNHFRSASSESEALRNIPKPVEAAPEASVDKASKPVSALPPPEPVSVSPNLPPPSPVAPSAPNVYKGGDYTPIVNRAADRYGLEPGLIQAMIRQESGGNPNAKSNKGAKGLMQLLDSTARTYGVKDPNDPEQNIDAGAHYMSDLLKRYEGNEEKALAAYNAGPDAVDKYNGVPPYKETKNYVESIQKKKPLPANFTPSKADVADFEEWDKTGPPNVPGMVTPGNIDLSKRPLVHHSDGSVSSLYSYSFGTEDGEVLIPGVSPEGKMLTEKQAEKLYEETGQNLGIFKDPRSADAYANLLHDKQGAFQTYKNGGKYNPSIETYDRWKPKKE